MANQGGSALDKDMAFGMAQSEMEYRVELFNKVAQTCFKKCFDKRHTENELNLAETGCIDKCVSKYWMVTNIVGQILGANHLGS